MKEKWNYIKTSPVKWLTEATSLFGIFSVIIGFGELVAGLLDGNQASVIITAGILLLVPESKVDSVPKEKYEEVSTFIVNIASTLHDLISKRPLAGTEEKKQ